MSVEKHGEVSIEYNITLGKGVMFMNNYIRKMLYRYFYNALLLTGCSSESKNDPEEQDSEKVVSLRYASKKAKNLLVKMTTQRGM